MTRLRLRMVTVLVLGSLTLRALVAVGSGTLAVPPVGSWTAASAWYEQFGPEVVALVGLRLLAMGGLVWLLAGATLQLVASLSLRRGVQRLADAVSPLVLRRLAHGVASLSVTAALATPFTPADDPPGTAVMQVLDDDVETSSSAPPSSAVAAPAEPAGIPPPTPEVVDDQVVVGPGDSFWSLAEDAVIETAAVGQPTERAIADYWRRLIEANRAQLVDPSNPDLLFPGQVLVLPGEP